MPGNHHDLLLLGHYCHDTLLLPGSPPIETLGGGVAYGGRALENAGAQFSVVSWVGQDFRYWEELPRNADAIATVRTTKRAPTTAFIDDERATPRRQTVTAVCKNIQTKDLPTTLPRTAVFTGLMGEIEPEVITALATKTHTALFDAQGLLRRRLPDGSVALQNLGDTPYGAVFAALNANHIVFKASRREAAHLPLEQMRRHCIIIITDGPKGATLLTATDERRYPTRPVAEVDPTGAGDCFLAGLASALHENRGLDEAIHQAQAWGAAAVTSPGLPPRP